MKDKVKFNVQDSNEMDINDISQDEEIINFEEPQDIPNEDENNEIEDDLEQPFYVGGVYDELRDAMQDTDFRLFLIGNDLVIPGTLDGNDIQFLDIVGEDEDKEFVMKPAPNSLEDVLDFKTLYNVTNSEVDTPENMEVSEPPHEEIVEYILNLKVADQDAEDVEDDEKEIESKEKEEEEDKDESNEE